MTFNNNRAQLSGNENKTNMNKSTKTPT